MLDGGHQRTRRLPTGAWIGAARDRVPLEHGDPLPIRGSQLELKGPRRVGDALREVEREQAPRQGNRRAGTNSARAASRWRRDDNVDVETDQVGGQAR